MTFTAFYRDGYTYRSRPDEVSQQDPTKGAFYDIRYKPVRPESDLLLFAVEFDRRAVAVDLRNGRFLVNGMPCRMTEEDIAGAKLVFHRRHRTTVDGDQVTYRIGWETETDSRIMEIL